MKVYAAKLRMLVTSVTTNLLRLIM
jgi:hypothetical protein